MAPSSTSRRANGTSASFPAAPRVPLIDILREIDGLRGMRELGRISELEYRERRSQVLNRF